MTLFKARDMKGPQRPQRPWRRFSLALAMFHGLIEHIPCLFDLEGVVTVFTGASC